MVRTINPFKKIPYTIQDISIVIPHVDVHKKRLEWFVPQFKAKTPPEIIANTIFISDGDKDTIEYLHSQGFPNVQTCQYHQSTDKFMQGLSQVNTRLCIRMHNDCAIYQSTWVDYLLKQFNSQPGPQLIGGMQPSGDMSLEIVNRVHKRFPMWEFEATPEEIEYGKVGIAYHHAYFNACQTSYFKEVYRTVFEINEAKMDKEDCLLTLVAQVYNVDIVTWPNIHEFVAHVGVTSADEADTVWRDFNSEARFVNFTEGL
jgi:hypothetical protein